MQMMSAGALGGGISAALAIAVGFGLVFMLAVLGGGQQLYSVMGGSGASLTAALTYSNVVFSGAILIWVFTTRSAVPRSLRTWPGAVLRVAGRHAIGPNQAPVATAPAVISPNAANAAPSAAKTTETSGAPPQRHPATAGGDPKPHQVREQGPQQPSRAFSRV